MPEAYLFGGVRTPFGRHAGVLASVRPDDLLATAIRALVVRHSVDGAGIEDVVVGCANQAGEDCRNVARRSALLAGLPLETGGVTVNRLCSSGLAAVLDATRAAANGDGDLFIAGGVESMSRAPFVVAKAERAYSRALTSFDSAMGSRFPNPRFVREYGDPSMAETADCIGRELEIDRTASDEFAQRSQARYAEARAAGFFADEIVPVEVEPRGECRRIADDEQPRPESNLAELSRLPTLFEGGLVTAGNASGVNDGAVALLVGTLAAARRVGSAPLARVVASAVAGGEPRTMGLGPVPASRKALDRAGLRLADIDLIEINEAFATQVLGCLKQLEIDAADPRVNPNGGAIAVGHPLGASGARLVLTAVRHLRATGGRYALVSLCVGVGQGLSAVLERV